MRSLLLGALPLIVACGTTAHPLEVAIPIRETARGAGPPAAVKPEERKTSGLLGPYSDAPIEKMSLEDISEEARAQGFTVSGWDMVDTGIPIHATWMPRPSSGQFLGIRVFDLPNGAGEVSRAGYDRALELDVFRGRVLGETRRGCSW